MVSTLIIISLVFLPFTKYHFKSQLLSQVITGTVVLLVAASKSRAGFVVKVNQTLSQQLELGAAGQQSELGNINLQLTL